jgi:ribosomal-protein-alanine N-acetyltransferase
MTDHVFNNFPSFDIGDFLLRELSIKDAKDFFNYMSDPNVGKYISDEDLPRSLAAAEEELAYWASLFSYRRSVYWGIALKKSNQLIGTCGFNVWSRTHRRAEISYDLNRTYWGKGIMTKALRIICDYAFAAMDVNRIQATVAHDNIGSIRVLEKLDFSKEGSLREYGILHGQKKDFYMYSLLSKDIVF